MSVGGKADTSSQDKLIKKSSQGLDQSTTASNALASESLSFVNDFFDTYLKPSLEQLNQSSATATQRNDQVYGIQAEQLADREAQYQAEGKPAISDFLETAREFSTDEYAERQAGLAIGDVAKQAQIAEGTINRQLGARGVRANSGNAVAAIARNTNDVALAKAGQANRARDIAKKMGIELQDRAASYGMDMSKLAPAIAQSQIATIGQGAAIPANQIAAQNTAGNFKLPTQGLAADIYGNNTRTWSSLYQGGVESKQKAQQAESEGWGKLAGTVVGTGLKIAGSYMFPAAAPALAG